MVNLAAACILTSTEYARELGIPEEKWIYPLSGAGYRDSDHCTTSPLLCLEYMLMCLVWDRPSFHTSPAICKSLDQCISTSGLSVGDIDIYDFYSCFPIVPKLACHHLGLPITDSSKPLSVLGGLTSFGGAGNNYSMHVGLPHPGIQQTMLTRQAITEMTRQLRNGQDRHGLVLANGGVLSYQHAVCLSSRPRESPYPDSSRIAADSTDAPPVVEDASGPAVIEVRPPFV